MVTGIAKPIPSGLVGITFDTNNYKIQWPFEQTGYIVALAVNGGTSTTFKVQTADVDTAQVTSDLGATTDGTDGTGYSHLKDGSGNDVDPVEIAQGQQIDLDSAPNFATVYVKTSDTPS